jgi:hypothetical protein
MTDLAHVPARDGRTYVHERDGRMIVNHIQRKQKRARPDSFKAIGALATKAVLREK